MPTPLIADQNPWLIPLPTTSPPSTSELLIRALEAHTAAEAHDTAEYERLAQATADPVVQLLVGLIAEDQQRHTRLLQHLIRRLHEEVEFTPSPTALPVPDADGPTEAERGPHQHQLARPCPRQVDRVRQRPLG